MPNKTAINAWQQIFEKVPITTTIHISTDKTHTHTHVHANSTHSDMQRAIYTRTLLCYFYCLAKVKQQHGLIIIS